MPLEEVLIRTTRLIIVELSITPNTHQVFPPKLKSVLTIASSRGIKNTLPNNSKVLRAFINGLLAEKGVRHRVLANQLARCRDLVMINGCILKDKGQPWLQRRSYDIPQENLQKGRLQHITVLTAMNIV